MNPPANIIGARIGCDFWITRVAIDRGFAAWGAGPGRHHRRYLYRHRRRHRWMNPPANIIGARTGRDFWIARGHADDGFGAFRATPSPPPVDESTG